MCHSDDYVPMQAGGDDSPSCVVYGAQFIWPGSLLLLRIARSPMTPRPAAGWGILTLYAGLGIPLNPCNECGHRLPLLLFGLLPMCQALQNRPSRCSSWQRGLHAANPCGHARCRELRLGARLKTALLLGIQTAPEVCNLLTFFSYHCNGAASGLRVLSLLPTSRYHRRLRGVQPSSPDLT